jgi:hypothetical protein
VLAEGRELDLARPIEDGRRRIEGQVLECRLGIDQVLAVVGVAADGRDEPDGAQQEEAAEEQEGDREGDSTGRAAAP